MSGLSSFVFRPSSCFSTLPPMTIPSLEELTRYGITPQDEALALVAVYRRLLA